jgi:hypothetical protein
MIIPLDNLYNYIDGLFPENVCMYLFFPHGSRHILNLQGVKPFDRIKFNLDANIFPQVICNDQEPLNYSFYQNLSKNLVSLFKDLNTAKFLNLKIMLPINLHDNPILLHSEKNSPDLELYKKENYIDVYYWCHAFIAKDWYRFAKYDKRLLDNHYPEKDFLIYCRDWSGSREYRLKFQELLYTAKLLDNSITSIKKINSDGVSVSDLKLVNEEFSLNNFDFLTHIPENIVDSSSSAHYSVADVVNTKISIILETIFDGTKIHLTEKIFRPIACGHPFMLAAGPGSLEYLKSYGFKTFSPWIDESYDAEPNSLSRLKKIVEAMQEFSNLPAQIKQKTYLEIKKIADYNKQWFFSDEFINRVNDELVNNINDAMVRVKQTRSLNYRKLMKKSNFKAKQRSKEKRKIIASYLRKIKNSNPILK